MKAHYSIFVQVQIGTGNYGTDRQCVFDAKDTPEGARQMAQSTLNLYRARVEVFKGKGIGRFQFALDP